jgi:hypothetical protein
VPDKSPRPEIQLWSRDAATFRLKAKGVAFGLEEDRDGDGVRTPETNSESCAERQGMQGMFGDGGRLGASEAVSDLRACGMLRQFEEQACYEAFSQGASSNYSIVRAGRGLALVLCGRDHDLMGRAATASSQRENRMG